ncbi:MAG: hypothetical protein JXA10_12555, partial [Anaerolineae bacterium]|nr:hypothetical protein [Anaerolineae bacterium]
MHTPGTLTIWRTISVLKRAPRYALLYWHYQRRRQLAAPHYHTLNFLLNGTYFVMGLLLPVLAFGGVCLAFT